MSLVLFLQIVLVIFMVMSFFGLIQSLFAKNHGTLARVVGAVSNIGVLAAGFYAFNVGGLAAFKTALTITSVLIFSPTVTALGVAIVMALLSMRVNKLSKA